MRHFFIELTLIIFYAILCKVHIVSWGLLGMRDTTQVNAKSSGSRFILFFVFSFVCAGILVLIAKYSIKSKYILPDGDGAFLVLLFLLIFLFSAFREGILLIRDGMRHCKTLWTERVKNRRESEEPDKSHQM